MPDLDTTLHLDMLNEFRQGKIKLWIAANRGYASREELEKAVRSGLIATEPGPNNSRLLDVEDLDRIYGRPRGDLYGLHWGDPESVEPLRFVKNQYVLPLIRPEFTAVEIGPGGGRWTQYLKAVRRLYVVDFYQEMLDEFRRGYAQPNIVPVKNNGDDFPGIGDGEVDFLFTFDVFVHLELPLIRSYLENMWRILKPGGKVLIHYADQTKIMARQNPAFGINDPDTMRDLVRSSGYTVLEEDTTTMWHSSIIMFQRPADGEEIDENRPR